MSSMIACQSPTPETEETPEGRTDLPNVILIMADDLGYECLGAYGSLSYQTPILDAMAAGGLLFENCMSQPLCTPSRLKIMTGLYNYRNYDRDGWLPDDQYTFGNLMEDAGYATCIAGKWQLNGIRDKDEYPNWSDTGRPNAFGFQEYCLYRLTQGGSRYVHPTIERNGELVPATDDDFGPDIFSGFITDFIRRHKDQSFFVYYPMVLTHEPFSPTPDSEAWADPANRRLDDTSYYADMVAYTDKVVGHIISTLQELDLDENTLVLFTGDNGTPREVYTHTSNGIIQGGKGLPTDAGTHTPLIAWWPGRIRPGRRHVGLVEFSDFFPTLAEIAGTPRPVDGQSFYPLLIDSSYLAKETTFLHFVPKSKVGPAQYRHQFVRTLDYKLYRDGRFYDLQADVLEEHPLNPEDLTEAQTLVLQQLQTALSHHPDFGRTGN